MQPNISEFSYGYAITDELIHWHGMNISAAPIFPSLVQEGRPGGGWDVMLQQPGILLFLQFKLSHCMIRSNAYECYEGWFSPPFYRMPIRPSRLSNQHEMLLDLEQQGNEVYYSTPAFHEPWELNEVYMQHNVKNSSIWIRPSWVGSLPDDSEHHIAFQHPGLKRFCSESRTIDEKCDFDSVNTRIVSSLQGKGKWSLKSENLLNLAKEITEISRKRYDIRAETYEATKEQTESWSPLERIAFFSTMFIGAQLFIVNEFG